MVPHLEYTILEDCGHDMDVDQPEITAAEILRFYDKHWNAQKNQRIQNDRDYYINRKYPNYQNSRTNPLSFDDIDGIVLSQKTIPDY